jgi:hypothetical protein
MITKKEFKLIIKQELFSLKLFLKESEKNLIVYKNFNNDYELEKYYDTYFLNLLNVFYKLNSILLKIKYKILINKKQKIKTIVNEVFGSKNGNNVFSLLSFIESETNVSFDKNFVYYCVVIETLVRHQYSHGFGTALCYLLDNHQQCFLFHDYDRWNKYKEIEGNTNAFFAINLHWLKESDFFHSTHFHKNKQFTYVLNTLTSRKMIQHKWMEIKRLNKNPMLLATKKNKIMNGKFPYSELEKICVHKYEEKWEYINDFENLHSKIMFSNQCKEGEKCNICTIKDSIPNHYSDIQKTKIIDKVIKQHNRNRCYSIFQEVIKEKLQNSKMITDYKKFNNYYDLIFTDIFGYSKGINYFIAFNEENNNQKIKNIKEIYNLYMDDEKVKFICYTFDKDNFIPLQRKYFPSYFVNDFVLRTDYDLTINYKIFFIEVEKNFIKFYKKLQ